MFVCACTGTVPHLKQKKTAAVVFLKSPVQTLQFSVANWFQGTQPISQYYNQAKSLPVGW